MVDGRLEFDWKILSRSFGDIKYEVSHAMAMVPTVTSVSRKCLLSNKFPRELGNPRNQSKEKKEFVDCARSMGYADAQIGYGRIVRLNLVPLQGFLNLIQISADDKNKKTCR